MSTPQESLVTGFLGRLKFPQLFLLAAALFLFDLFIPDFLPFVDEILLAIGTVVLGSWQKKVKSGPRPPMKDVTPEDD